MATPQPPYDGAPAPQYTSPQLHPQPISHSNSQTNIPAPQHYPSNTSTAALDPPKSLWERPQNLPTPEPAYQSQPSYNSQMPQSQPQQHPQPSFGGQQKSYNAAGGQGQMGGQPSQVQVVYVKDDRKSHEDAALGCCAGCLAGCCCCGCTVM